MSAIKWSGFILLIIFLFYSPFVKSQAVYIPDTNFFNRLIELGVDYDGNGEISYNEAKYFTGSLILDSLNIADLTGIEAFWSLSKISAKHNHLSAAVMGDYYTLDTLDLSYNQINHLSIDESPENLFINCNYNSIDSLDLDDIDQFSNITAQHNEMKYIDLAGRPDYYKVDIRNNNIQIINDSLLNGLQTLQLSGNPLDTIILRDADDMMGFDCSNTGLYYLELENCTDLFNLYCRNNKLKKLDLSNITSLQKLYCEDNQLDSLVIPKWVRNLNCRNNKLNSKGKINLEELQWLSYLNCSGNSMTELQLHPKADEFLISLKCQNNNLKGFSFSNFKKLEHIECSNNGMFFLNLEGCDNLETVSCAFNKIKRLDVTAAKELQFLDVSYNINLSELCVDLIPLSFTLVDYGTMEYQTVMCNTNPYSKVFKAGQTLYTYYNISYVAFSGTTYIDLTNDGVNDVKTVTYHTPGSYEDGIVKLYMEPLGNVKISAIYDSTANAYRAKGFLVDTEIYPVNTYYHDHNLLCIDVYYWMEDQSYSWSKNYYLDWGHYLPVEIPGEFDTTYTWVYFNDNYFWGGRPEFSVKKWASWATCPEEYTIGNDTSISINDNLIIDAGPGHDQIYWNTGDTSRIIEFSGMELGIGNHEFIAYVRDPNCYYSDTINVLVYGPNDINDNNLPGIHISPNPVTDYFNIHNPGPDKLFVSISNLNGKIVYQMETNSANERININQLSSGLYFCRITSARKQFVFKLLKY